MPRVGIVGVGWFGFQPETPAHSFREMVYKAANRAYVDAGGLDPRRDVDAFVSCQEDFWEGISISDEFAPDQLGGAMRPVYTVAGDGLQGLASAFMMIRSGQFDVVVVESHAKPSDVETLGDIVNMAMDPITMAPLRLENPHALAALEARLYMHRTGATEEDLAAVVVRAKRNAMRNPRASFAMNVGVDDYLAAGKVLDPLRRLDVAPLVDAAVVVVLASEEEARRLTDSPVWVRGVGWSTETSQWELHDMEYPRHAAEAARMAYRMAGIDDPGKAIQFAEVDNRYSFKELQFIEALGLAGRGEAVKMLREGAFEPGGRLPVNASGGALGEGVPFEAHGLARLLYAVEALRGMHGPDGETALVHGWRGVPTTTSAAVVLGR
ncbi:acetyl-CoA acetyltransferase [Thermocladium modestius]|uniref:Acetyl-CoA acetyltransferase n=1 Tax=Thermocladium modestius TaxID=62609 RepID=A0A830GS61_9CREN|nr:thiolase domain-containing protein [Thermocladium modestius]GGP18930.1 acetyl-CoA acetyltransferase [Thermocladium modestius]